LSLISTVIFVWYPSFLYWLHWWIGSLLLRQEAQQIGVDERRAPSPLSIVIVAAAAAACHHSDARKGCVKTREREEIG